MGQLLLLEVTKLTARSVQCSQTKKQY